MVEVMISVLLVGIAAAFVFSIQVRATAGFRDQATVSETQQTLRSAMDLIEHDVREAGFHAMQMQNATTGASYQPAVVVLNNVSGTVGAAGTDVITVQYADISSKYARVLATDPGPCPTTTTSVDVTGGFVVGDVVFATHLNPSSTASMYGWGCVFQITSINNSGAVVTFTHAAAAPYNLTGSSQCSGICSVWTDPEPDLVHSYTQLAAGVMRSYRIKPSDIRGVLQMSPSGMMVANDWQDMAVGIVDLQAAIRIYQPGDSTDSDGDGDPQRDWYSSSNMATALSSYAGSQLLDVSVTLVAKSTKNITGATRTKSPDVFETGKPLANNSIGDHAGTVLPVTDPTSMYYGNVIYRSYTKIIDLRNVGVGD